MIAIDTEDTGLDFYHGTMPFLVTTCYDDGTQKWFEWDVNPLTRKVSVPPADVAEIRNVLTLAANWMTIGDEEIRERHVLIGQNLGFDAHALGVLGLSVPWVAVRDTLLASHLLSSGTPHDLTSLALRYLGVDILPWEEKVKKATQECRRMVQQARLAVKRGKDGDHPLAAWRIAEAGSSDMPSVRGDQWHADMWLPRAMIKWLWRSSEAYHYWRDGICTPKMGDKMDKCMALPGYEYHPPEFAPYEAHPWWTVTSDYANTDSAVTVALWPVMYRMLVDRGLLSIYRERLKLLPVIHGMERRGPTIDSSEMERTRQRFLSEADEYRGRCEEVAGRFSVGGEPYRLELPRSGNNGSLTRFVFDVMGLPVVKRSKKTGAPSFDKEVVDHYLETLEEGGRELEFMGTLRDKRQRDKAVADMETYSRYMLPLEGSPGWCVLHPRVNATGTATLRMSSDNPNSQSVSKQGEFTLRAFFGPAPGREWYSLDYENIELRIPAYESGERVMIDLFERPDDPPFYGSYHLLNASIIYPDLFWEEVCPECLGEGCPQDFGNGRPNRSMCGDRRVKLGDVKGGFKRRYESTWYRFVKFFGFAFSYGGQERTCDRSARRPGSWARVRENLKEHSRLNSYWVKYAEKHGYVETVPDRNVDPRRGYPVECARGEYGRISPTVPLNYHVQSTASECNSKAMVRCDDQLRRWTESDPRGYYMVMTVHDELVFDMPAGLPGNRAKVARLRYLMEESGRDIGIPLRVAVSYHPRCWGESVKM